MDIKRDASDKHKGITLQKLRAIKLSLDILIKNPKAQFHVAIESDGDVFIYSDNRKFIEENKNYDSKNFSFFSKQVLNTLVYFLDYWLKDSVNQSDNVVFSFYSTNNISKENKTVKIKNLDIDSLPNQPILQLLQTKDWNKEDNVLEICKKVILNEYEEQYKGKNNHYLTLEKFSKEDWVQFFNQIIWNFGMPNEIELEQEIKKKISNYGELKNIDVSGKEIFIEAMLRKRLEDKQNEKDITQRYLTDKELELIFYQVKNQPIDKNIFRYINYDYKEIIENINNFNHIFIKDKYFSVNNSHTDMPIFLHRKVKYHTPEIRIETIHLEEKNPEIIKKNVIVGELGDFINDTKPVFLFGEIGSGKSSIIAQYAIQQNNKNNLSILIPINYIKGKITSDFSSLFICINNFINSNISNKDPFFDFEFIINNRPVKVVFDGLDELSSTEARYLTKHLEKLFNDYSDLIIIATGRPIELQSLINFNDWSCLTTIDLSENEVLEILENEAIAHGLKNAKEDALQRLEFLKSRSELSILSKTPLVVCLVRNFLTEDIYEETLGTLMYKILLTRLRWDEIDLKSNYPHYFEEYPQEVQREKIIAIVAEEIFNSESKRISEIKFKQIVNENVFENIKNRNQVISEAILFYKNLFLQLNDGYYSFISQPLLEVCYSVELTSKINKSGYILNVNSNTWRPYSFAIAISKLKFNVKEELKNIIIQSLDDLLIYESNIPIASIIVSESKNEEVAKHFISKLSKLSFRPLRTWNKSGIWGDPDSYTPLTIADSIYLSGTEGVNWFLLEYLDSKHPISHYENTIIKVILGSLYYIKKFNIDDENKQILLDAAKYHLAARTLSCQYFLPIICLIIPDEIKIEYKSVMLVQLLNDRMYSKRSKELIKIEINNGNKRFILNAIERLALKDEDKNITSLLLYLDLYEDENKINRTVINKIIKLSAEGDEKLLKKLFKSISENSLITYLKFSVLNNTKISDYAAILLFKKYNEKNLHLIARPILEKTHFSTHYSDERKKILDEILFFSPEDSLNLFLSYRPKSSHFKGGLMEFYIYYFIKLLIHSDRILKNDFYYIIANHPDYPILNRYSDIRNIYKQLLTQKPQYFDFLTEAQENIDYKIRYNANSIRLVCFPEDAGEQLENIIYSAADINSDIYDWLIFCMKLNYNRKVLDNLRSKLDSFPELSQIYILFILYHQGIKLTDLETNKLISGLLDKGSMFDIGGFLIEENSDRLSMQSKYLSQFLEAMNDKDLSVIFRVSGILLSYHYEKLSKYDLGKAHVYNCQSWVKELYDFDRYHYELMNDEDFMKGFEDANNLILERTGKQSNLSLYKKVIIDKSNYWLDLIMQLTHDGDFSIDFKSETLYNWILSLRKKDRTLVNGVGFAATEILSYPAIIENHMFHTYFPYYALIADEFSPEGFNDLESALINYSSKSEVQAALLKRIGNIPEGYYIDDSKQYLSAFSPNNSTNILKRNKEDVEKIFLESQVIPNSVIDYIESIIFFNPYDTNELEIKKDEGNIAKIIIAIILFCQDSKVDFSTILKALDKTGWYFNRSSIESVLGESIYIIKEIMIQDEKYRNSYISEIKQNILDQKGKIGNNVIDNFNELFSLDDNIEINYLKILFEELLNYPYYLSLNLMYTIFNFIIKKLDYSDYEILSKEIENNIKTLKNKGFRNGMEDNIIPLLWMFSLIAFFIDGEKRDYSSFAFLRGIESIFIINTDRQYLNVNKEKMKISSRDLLMHSECIFQRIQSNVIKSAFIEGTMNAEPEIKSLCLMLQAFANR